MILILKIKQYFLGQVIPLISFQLSSFILPWLTTIWLTYKYGLNEAGSFTFALAVISPISLMLASPSRNFILTKKNIVNISLYCRITLMAVGLLIAGVIGIYFETVYLFTILFLFKSSELLLDVPICIAIHKNNIKSLWFLNLIKWAIIIVIAIAAFSIGSIELLYFLFFLAFLITSILSTKKENRKGNIKQIINLLTLSVPLGVSALIFSFHFNIPRYVIGLDNQNEILAIYSISSFLIMGAIVLINILVQVKLPILSQAFKTNLKTFQKESIKLILVTIFIFFVLQLAHVSYISQLFWNIHNNVQQSNIAYSELYTQIILLAWGPLCFSLVNYFLIISNQHKTLLYITLVNLFFTYIICTISYKYFGINNLIWAYNLGCILQSILIFIFFQK